MTKGITVIFQASLVGDSHFDHKLKEIFNRDKFYLWSFAKVVSDDNIKSYEIVTYVANYIDINRPFEGILVFSTGGTIKQNS